MADSRPSEGSMGGRADREAPPGAPRWAKVFGIVAVAALVLAFVLMHAVGGGMRGH
ncbi:hypothetical protein Stsp02_20390 [Streptomyces sp. NBRC 14336]|uniref:Uncharacterized protein n=1 Tax=Streptomyces thermocarboxydovorans TaxID=59298 RepID=A0ABN1HFF0_9ACTN|nr:hypothetical protein [Streptomyces sp. NBRC 14336]GLW46377.1 hypothetical protein Stsp02_20390 [Streptomyces sp. NBRC 14336]